MAQLLQILREASPQRTVSLWKDQELRIAEISVKLGKKISYTDLVREGVDKLLDEIDKSIK